MTYHCPHCDCGIGNKDDFSANDGRPHGGWTYDNFFGTPAGNRPTNTGGKFFFELPAIEIFDTANPDGASGSVHAKALIKLHEKTSGSGDMAGIIVGWLNATTFLHVSLSYHSETADPGGCDYLEFWACDAIAGGRYIFARLPIRGMTLDQDHELHVCLKPDSYYYYPNSDTVRAHVKLADGTYWGRQAYATGYDGSGFTGGAQAGLITSSNSGTDNQAYFDDWAYEHFKNSDSYRCCHNCNTPCFIFDDDLAHGDLEADGTLVGDEIYNTAIVKPFYQLTCFWGVLSGTARFADTTVIQWLEIEAGGKVMCRLPHPQGKTAKIVTVDFYWESGRVIRVDLGTGYALFTPGTVYTPGTIQLYDNDDNLLGQVTGLPIANGDQYSCRVCYHHGVLTVSLTGAGVGCACLEVTSPDTGDPYVYLGSDGGTVHFRNFRFVKHLDFGEPEDRKCGKCSCVTPECPPATIPCPICIDGVMCQWLLIEFPAMADAFCSDCASIPSYVLEAGGPDGTGGCIWQDVNIAVPCSAPGFFLGLVRAVIRLEGSDYTLTATLQYGDYLGTQTSVAWKVNLGPEIPDCTNWDRIPLPFFEYTNAPAPHPIQCLAEGTIAYASTLCSE